MYIIHKTPEGKKELLMCYVKSTCPTSGMKTVVTRKGEFKRYPEQIFKKMENALLYLKHF